MEVKKRYINPLTDFGFKRIFGTEANVDLLIDFLNCTLPLESPVVRLHFRNVEQIPNTEDDRKAIFDLYCYNEAGEGFVIEMQKSKLRHFKDRGLFYVSFPIQQMADMGPWNFRLRPIYYLAILDFFYEPEAKAILERTVQLKDEYNEVFYDKLLFKYIQLPAFKKNIEDLASRKEQWYYFLQNLENLEEDIPQLFQQDKIFSKMITIAEIAKLSPDEFQNYEVSRMQYLEIKGIVETAYEDGAQESADKYLQRVKTAEQAAEEAQRREEEAQRREEEERRQKEESQRREVILMSMFVMTLHNSGKSAAEIAVITNIPQTEVERIISESKS